MPYDTDTSTNSNGYRHGYTDSDGYSYRHRYTDSDVYGYANRYRRGYTDPNVRPNTCRDGQLVATGRQW